MPLDASEDGRSEDLLDASNLTARQRGWPDEEEAVSGHRPQSGKNIFFGGRWLPVSASSPTSPPHTPSLTPSRPLTPYAPLAPPAGAQDRSRLPRCRGARDPLQPLRSLRGAARVDRRTHARPGLRLGSRSSPICAPPPAPSPPLQNEYMSFARTSQPSWQHLHEGEFRCAGAAI